MSKLLLAVPLAIALLFAVKLIGIYLLAVYYGHVNPLYPFISDSGATHPEAGYFSILLFLEAILIGAFGWIRFKQIRFVCANNPEFNNNDKRDDSKRVERLLRFNRRGLYVSIVIMLSMAAVGAFRSTEHLELHLLIGAFPAFGCSFAYFCLQTWTSYKLTPTVNTLSTARFRFLVTSLAFIVGTIMMITVIVASIQAASTTTYDELRGHKRLTWNESWGGFEAHVVSTITENVMIFLICPFYASFVTEFARIESHNGKLKFKFLGGSVVPTNSL